MSVLSVTWAKAASLFFLTFFSEDAATLGGAAMAAAGLLATPLGLAACFLGIWLGDLGLYALARYFGRPFLKRNWVQRRVNDDRLARSEAWWKRRGLLVLLVARFVPGLRLPTYLIAGTLAVPFLSFAAVTALMGLVWVPLIFVLVWMAGTEAVTWYAAAKGHAYHRGGKRCCSGRRSVPFAGPVRGPVARPPGCSAGCNGNSGRPGCFIFPLG